MVDLRKIYTSNNSWKFQNFYGNLLEFKKVQFVAISCFEVHHFCTIWSFWGNLKKAIFLAFFIGKWGWLDSNQRKPKSRDLQSLAIAAMRHPRMCWRKDLNPQPPDYKSDALPLSYTSKKSIYYNLVKVNLY